MRIRERYRGLQEVNGEFRSGSYCRHEEFGKSWEAHTEDVMEVAVYDFYAIVICAGGSGLASRTDGPGTMMVRTPSCISVMTFSTYLAR